MRCNDLRGLEAYLCWENDEKLVGKFGLVEALLVHLGSDYHESKPMAGFDVTR